MPPRDPLKISYVLVLPETHGDDTSPFQGFSAGWTGLIGFVEQLATLPADIAENKAPIDGLISQRMGGARMLSWTPVNIDALEQIPARLLGYFVVAFTADPATAARVEAWRAHQTIKPLHVSSTKVEGAVAADEFDEERLVAHLRQVLQTHGDQLDERRRIFAAAMLDDYVMRAPEPSGLKMDGHNMLLGDQMSLTRAGRSFEEGEPFQGRAETDYDTKTLETLRAVFAARDRAGLDNMHRLILVHPELWLVEPALFRWAYQRIDWRKAPDRASAEVVKMLQQQSGFLMTSPDLEQFFASAAAQETLRVRQGELHLFMATVGLAAASTTSAVMRLRPAVNRVYPLLSAYARSVRSNKAESKHKARRLFGEIQEALSQAVGPERMAFLDNEVTGPVKIVADPPIEWLPIRGLPLMLRHQCSRINATPGNLMIGELATNQPTTVAPQTVQDILVVSSFLPHDPLRNVMAKALEAMAPQLDRLKIKHVHISTVEAFEAELNAFTGAVMVFDGHGWLDDGHGVSTLMIGDTPLDVWSLRGRVRPPPIVLLSACDTHGADAASHATVGNGFLAMGSLTVMATLLPVGGQEAAQFIARFLYRLAAFIPDALAARHRVLNWTEIVTGMQRMIVTSEILDGLVNKADGPFTARGRIQSAANLNINTGKPDWYERLLADIARHRGETVEAVTTLAERVVARSEAIRYIQLGHPENILIDDGGIHAAVVPEPLRDIGAIGVDPAYPARREEDGAPAQDA